jgi:hypothetical protein
MKSFSAFALALIALGGTAVAATNSVTIKEVDGATQTNRLTTFGRPTAAGEIATCSRPIVGGSALDTSHYQVDKRNAWTADSSQKYAVITIKQTLAANSSTDVTFQNTATCNNSGFLTQAQMLAFNESSGGAGDGWGAAIKITANGTTCTVNARTMLTALSIADRQIEYLMQGPLVTQVLVQDATSASSFDCGWTWDGTTMTSPVSGNSATASLHPAFILTFNAGTNAVKVDYIVENSWINRRQDQNYSIELDAGNALASVYTKSTFTHYWGQRWRKTFWSGTTPGHIRIDHNFEYLIGTKLVPSYDLTQQTYIDPSSQYTTFAASADKGDIAQAGWGASTWPNPWTTAKSYPDNNEGALVQAEDLYYLYNMNVDCGTVNGKCAKAWDMLTGEVDANASNTLTGVSGGAGAWNNIGNVPIHFREGRSVASTYFYCPTQDNKNAVPATACGGSVSYTGRPLSRDADTSIHTTGVNNLNRTTTVGTVSSTGWSHNDCSHELDYTYVGYLLTGDNYFREEEFFEASYCLATITSGTASNQSNGYYAYVNPNASNARWWAWALLLTGRAATIATDSSVEQSYYLAKTNSNLEVEAGFMNKTGVSGITPTSPNSSCTAYSAATANRWDWGRCTVGQNTATGLHAVYYGQCPTGTTALPSAKYGLISGTGTENALMSDFFPVVMWHVYRLGISNVSEMVVDIAKGPVEKTMDTTHYNPYLNAAEVRMSRGGSSCSGTPTDPYFTTDQQQYDTWDDGTGGTGGNWKAIATFNHATVASATGIPLNFPCANHGYSLLYRAGVVAAKSVGADSGSFLASDAYTWATGHVPYFNTAITGSTACGVSNTQVKWALTPDSVSTDSCTISAPASGATVTGTTVAITVSATSSGGTINSIVTSLNGSTANMPSTASTSLNTTFNSQLFANATYTLAATVTDDAGGSASCTGQSLIIANVYPSPISLGAGVKLGAGVSTH